MFIFMNAIFAQQLRITITIALSEVICCDRLRSHAHFTTELVFD